MSKIIIKNIDEEIGKAEVRAEMEEQDAEELMDDNSGERDSMDEWNDSEERYLDKFTE